MSWHFRRANAPSSSPLRPAMLGLNQPLPERGKVALILPELAIHQIPLLALGHGEREARDQPAGADVIVDVGPDAHGDADTIGRSLQRLTVVLKLRTLGGEPCHAGGL